MFKAFHMWEAFSVTGKLGFVLMMIVRGMLILTLMPIPMLLDNLTKMIV